LLAVAEPAVCAAFTPRRLSSPSAYSTVRLLGDRMLDLIYVLATILFFRAMIAYVRGCEALGHDQDTVEERTQ